ncbi:helix-turn-helix domain-containing protein [Mycobacterium sp.]|uniref:helix-turn-helix domain-containing protein n=1 Tax=Mycobacterium sp. TaxID=1785 RepID=UPI003A83F9F7
MTPRLRAVRKQRGLTLTELAGQTGLTKGYLSKVERGHSTPSIAVALKVARVLSVDIGHLFCESAVEENLAVDRTPDQSAPVERYRALATAMSGKSMAPFVVRPTAGAADDPRPDHAGQEFVFVHAGAVELEYGDRRIELATGESAYFDASIAHRLRAIGVEPTEIVVVTHTGPAEGYPLPTSVRQATRQ